MTIFGILVPFLGTCLGGACVLMIKRKIKPSAEKALLGFSAGVMTAASVWSLIIPAVEQSAHLGKLAFLPALIGFFLGIGLLPAVDKLLPRVKMDKTQMLVFAVTVHNIPEGMAISAPLASGGVKGWRTVLLTALAGAATVLGAVIGLAVGGISKLASGVCMGLAGGAMLYVTFCEILPQSILMEEGRVPAVSMLVGIICSMVFVFAF